ncbi:MAG TPA: hypothetical protein VGI70_06840, partial [Polyangiales bacterium]
MRQLRGFFVSLGSAPVCHLRAVLTLIAAAADDASCVFFSIIFCLKSLTCASVTIGTPQSPSTRPELRTGSFPRAVRSAPTGKSSCRRPAEVIVADQACLIFRCVTGDKPFPGANVTAILTKLLFDTPAPLSKSDSRVPAELDALVDLVQPAPDEDHQEWVARVISDNYFCRSTTITFAGRRRPNGAWETPGPE